MMTKIINLDMDGTFADLYSVDNWLTDLRAECVRPYLKAKPLVNLSILARYLNKLQKNGWIINIISWTAKAGSENYNKAVKKAKMTWLKNHIPSVNWDNIYIVPYGTPKESLAKGILFDDEENNRNNWIGTAYNADVLVSTLKTLATNN